MGKKLPPCPSVLSVVKTINSPRRTQRNTEKKTSVPLRALCGKKINSQRRTQRYTEKKPIAETVSIEKQIDEWVYKLY
jgi:hypothetical protein